jgi:hypothetical protein
MPRPPIEKHQRGVSRFVLQWLVRRALRYVEWDLSSLDIRKGIPTWIHSFRRVRMSRVAPVELHQGSIRAESARPDEGCTFIVELPGEATDDTMGVRTQFID